MDLCILCLYFDLQRGFDVFNALDLMDNKDFLEKLKFGIGDGNLQYYLYNWKCPGMTPEQVRYTHISLCDHFSPKKRNVKLLRIHCTKIGTREQFACACLHPLNGNSVGEVKVRLFYLSTRTFR